MRERQGGGGVRTGCARCAESQDRLCQVCSTRSTHMEELAGQSSDAVVSGVRILPHTRHTPGTVQYSTVTSKTWSLLLKCFSGTCKAIACPQMSHSFSDLLYLPETTCTQCAVPVLEFFT